MNRLRHIGLEGAGFLDNNPDLVGSEIEGLKVRSPGELARGYTGEIVVASSVASAQMLAQCHELCIANAMGQSEFVQRIGCRSELERIAVGSPAAAAADIWVDAESRDIYRSLMRYRITFTEVPRYHSPASYRSSDFGPDARHTSVYLVYVFLVGFEK